MPGPVNQAAYIDLEVSLMDAFERAWASYYKPFGIQIQKAIKEKNFSVAHDIVDVLDMAIPLSKVTKKADTLGTAAMLLGAKNVHRDVKKTQVYQTKPEQHVDSMVAQLELMVGRNFTLLLRRNAHDEIEWVKRQNLELGGVNMAAIVKEAAFDSIAIPSDEMRVSVTQSTRAIADAVGMRVVTGLDTRVTIESGGKSYMSMAASLHTNRARSLGFLVEAYQRDVAKYALKAHNDDRTSDTCKALDGKTFSVETGLQKIVQAAETDDPDALKSIAPWPKAKDVQGLSEEQLLARGIQVPPFHPFCRTVIVLVEQSSTVEVASVVPQTPVALDPSMPDVDAAIERNDKMTDMFTLSDGAYRTEAEYHKGAFGATTAELQQRLNKAVGDAGVYMAMDGAVFRNKVMKTGFKNSLETGKGTFKTIGAERAVKERLMFGITAADADFDKYPKYAFLSDADGPKNATMMGFGYGDTFVKFKKQDLLNRTTFTYGDSYNNNSVDKGKFVKAAPASLLAAPNVKSLRTVARVKPGSGFDARLKAASTIDEFAALVEYPEAQIYGKLGVESVEAVYTASRAEAIRLTTAIKKAKLPIDIRPLPSDPRMKDFIDSYDKKNLKLFGSMGPADIDRLSEPVLNKAAKRMAEQLRSNLKNFKTFGVQDMSGDLLETYLTYDQDKRTFNDTDSAKRFARAYTEQLLQRDKGQLKKLKNLWEDVNPSLTGWTADTWTGGAL